MSDALLVPVHLDALAVESDGQLSTIGVNKPLDGRPQPLKAGVYLHWALPDGLLRSGIVDSPDGANHGLQFESLPDQWLVVRLHAPSTTPWERGSLMTALLDRRRKLSAWVGNARTRTWQPLATGSTWPGPAPQPAGAHTPLWLTLAGELPEGRKDNPARVSAKPENPLGAGSPGLVAAYQPTSRFGFFDDLSGVSTGPLTYVVLGWYANMGDCDPLFRASLAGAFAEGSRAAWAAARGLSVVAGSSPSSHTMFDPVAGETSTFGGATTSFPDHLLLHGQVYEVAWRGKGGRYRGQGQAPMNPAAGIFQTGSAALAAMLGADEVPARAARAEAVGHGLMTELNPTGAGPLLFSAAARNFGTGLLQEIHRRGFRSLADPITTANPGDTAKQSWAQPVSPVVAIRGGGRGFRHGHDGRFSPDGTLRCRWLATGVVTSMSIDASINAGGNAILAKSDDTNVVAADLIEALEPASLSKGSALACVPAELRAILAECALLDPSNAELAGWAWAKRAGAGQSDDAIAAAAKLAAPLFRTQAELAVAQADPSSGAVAEELFLGTGLLPSPVAQTPWCQPWSPLFADISVSFFQSKGSPPALAPFWKPGPVEFSPLPTTLSADPAPALTWTDRVPLTHELLRRPLSHHERGPELDHSEERLQVADTLRRVDLLSGGLSDFYSAIAAKGWSVAAGAWKITGLRIVDTFGTWYTLIGGNTTPDSSPATARCTDRGIATVVRPTADRDLLDLTPARPHCFCKPRVPFWARLHARWLAGIQDDPNLVSDATAGPCGFLLPDHVEHGLEVFGALGFPLGQVQMHGGGGAWAPGPGSAVEVRSAALRGFRDWLLRPATSTQESALATFLRLIQLGGFTIRRDSGGTDARGLIFGRPLAVALVALRFEIKGDAMPLPQSILATLGSISQPNDGLIAWGLPAADGSLNQLYSVNSALLADETLAAAGQQVKASQLSPHLSAGSTFGLTGTWVRVLLVFDPHAAVHVTTGLLPRARLVPSQERIAAAIGRLCPAIRVGPVMIDPERPCLPVPSIPGYTWAWQAEDAQETNPYELPIVDPETPRGALPSGQKLLHGWLRLVPPRDRGWMLLDDDAIEGFGNIFPSMPASTGA